MWILEINVLVIQAFLEMLFKWFINCYQIWNRTKRLENTMPGHFKHEGWFWTVLHRKVGWCWIPEIKLCQVPYFVYMIFMLLIVLLVVEKLFKGCLKIQDFGGVILDKAWLHQKYWSWEFRFSWKAYAWIPRCHFWTFQDKQTYYTGCPKSPHLVFEWGNFGQSAINLFQVNSTLFRDSCCGVIRRKLPI